MYVATFNFNCCEIVVILSYDTVAMIEHRRAEQCDLTCVNGTCYSHQAKHISCVCCDVSVTCT